MANRFEEMLTGGHPNSLGKTVQVVGIVLKDRKQLATLFKCYESEDEVVRLRVSNAFKRIFRENPDWFKNYIDKFQKMVPVLKQPSAQWTLAQLHFEMEHLLSPKQKKTAIAITKKQIEKCDDWIVLNRSIDLLLHWSGDDAALRKWFLPRLKTLAKDTRKSVKTRAVKALKALEEK